jgi:hypothetical protein
MMMKGGQQEKQSRYANRADFCHIFEEKMSSLYLLSFLLTGEHSKAKQCFVAGLDEATDSPPVFLEWAHSWARRSIIQSAIHLLHLRPGAENVPYRIFSPDMRDGIFPTEQVQMMAVLELPAFERVVFVISVLERFSNQECSLLLGCTRREVTDAQTRALQQLGIGIQRYTPHPQSTPLEPDNERVVPLISNPR